MKVSTFLLPLLLPSPSPATEYNPFDLFSSIQTLNHLREVASTLTTLVDDNGAPINERILNAANTLSSPSLLSSVQHVLSNVDKLLSPEIVDTAVTLINVTPLIPERKRKRLVNVLDAVRVLLTPEFAADARRARKRLEAFGLDFYSDGYIDSLSGVLESVSRMFDPEYLQRLNVFVTAWRKILVSDQMHVFLEQVQDPGTVEGLLAGLEKVQMSITPQRIQRIRAIVENSGLVQMDAEARRVLGESMAGVLKGQFSEGGVGRLRNFLDTAEVLLQGHVLDDVGGLMQLRAMLLTPYMADEVQLWFKQTEAAADVFPAVLSVLRETMATVVPLMEPVGRAERVLEGPFAEDLGRVMSAISAVPMGSLVEVDRWLDTSLRLLEKEHLGGVRMLIADVSQTLATPRIFNSIGVGGLGNGSGMVMGSMCGVDMLGMVDTMPLMAPDALDKVRQLLDRVNAILVPSQVEKTRKTIAGLTAVVSMVVDAVDTMEDGDDEFHEEL